MEDKYHEWCQRNLGSDGEDFFSKIPFLHDSKSNKESIEKFKGEGGCYQFVHHKRFTIQAEEGCSIESAGELQVQQVHPAEMRKYLARKYLETDVLNFANVTWCDAEGTVYGHFVPIWFHAMETEEKVKTRLQALLKSIVGSPAVTGVEDEGN